MFSIKSIASIAAIAFGALSVLAAPTPLAETSIAQRDGPVSVAVIFSQVTETVTPLTAQLHSITSENCTVEVLTPIVTDIKTALSGALTQVNGLVGQPATVILASVDGTAQVTVQELAQIISDLLHLVLGAVGVVLQLAVSISAGAVITLLSELGAVIGSLVGAVLALVAPLLAGIVGVVLGLVGDITAIISTLHISALISVLGINLPVSIPL